MPADAHSPVRYRARWVFPVVADPIRDGVVEIRGGTIVAVGPARGGGPAIDLGDAALVPGLVNAHTHLEFSDFAAPIAPAQPFADWIRAVRAARTGRTMDAADAIARGLAESAAAGTALVGEIATGGWEAADVGVGESVGWAVPTNHADAVSVTPWWAQPTLHSNQRSEVGDRSPSSPRAVVFRELIGPAAERVAPQVALAREHLARFAEDASARTRAGLSPHAPYSVHPDLFEKIVALAERERAPLAMHLAETEAELEFLDRGTGPLADMLREFGFPPEALRPRRARPLDYLRGLARCERALVVHGNYLSREEIEFVAANDSLAVVYCPRTHAFFGHAEHPWREILRRGGRIALGTDSRASNPDLSLWNELLFLRARFPEFDPRALLALGTLRGAEALGDGSCGAIAPGRRGDLAVIASPDFSGDPWEALFQPQARVACRLHSEVDRLR
ncbi:MAG: amidohydrolase family protein [Planctomycetales bacterium]